MVAADSVILINYKVCLCFLLVCGWRITTAHPILTIIFKNILRTFEAEILKIFKNIQPQPKN